MSRSRLATLALSALLLPACIVYVEEDGSAEFEVDPPAENVAPTIEDAAAGCYWSPAYKDYIWWFEATIWDANGLRDVEVVYADVYEYGTGEWVDTFELYDETDDPMIWFSDWLEYSTWLDCSYGDYFVDITVFDSEDAYDFTQVLPDTEI